MAPKLLVIGGTGAQGSAILEALSASGKYDLVVLTRDTNSAAAQTAKAIPHVTLIQGDSSSDADLQNAFTGVEACYVNTNGFAIGEKEEFYWGMRIFEIASAAGVKHFVYAGLPYVFKRSGYNPKYHVGHLDGKGRVTEFISAQPTTPMNWTVVDSCLYLEMFLSSLAPTPSDDGKTYVFTSAVGEGSAPMIALPDLGRFIRWVFEHPEESRGQIISTATDHINWHDVVRDFTAVTGKPAVYNPVPPQAWGEQISIQLSGGPDNSFVPGGMKIADNFAGFMNVHSLATPGSHGLWPVDYKRLDEMVPDRLKSFREWMEKTNYTGEENYRVLRT